MHKSADDSLTRSALFTARRLRCNAPDQASVDAWSSGAKQSFLEPNFSRSTSAVVRQGFIYPLMFMLTLVAALCLPFAVSANGGDSKPVYAWVQHGLDRGTDAAGWSYRVILLGEKDCAQGDVGDSKWRKRPNPMVKDSYPVTVCESFRLMDDPRKIRWKERRFPEPSQDIKSVIAIGDTGCRGPGRQICAVATWPFKKIADAVAAKEPNLTVHVGDYVYQSTKTRSKEVGGSVAGWLQWESEFFRPAKQLLKTSPLLFIRGNHESCGRNSYNGWMLFLAPRTGEPFRPCVKNNPIFTKPYPALRLGDGTNLYVMDSANANQKFVPSAITEYMAQFETVNELAEEIGPGWLITHVPVLALTEYVGDRFPAALTDRGVPAATMAAVNRRMPLNNNIHTVVSGDVHFFEKYFRETPNGKRTQFIVGNGGVLLDPQPAFPEEVDANGRRIELEGALGSLANREVLSKSMFVNLVGGATDRKGKDVVWDIVARQAWGFSELLPDFKLHFLLPGGEWDIVEQPQN